MNKDIQYLENKYDFKLEDHPTDKKIQYLNFKDGRKYKLQHMSFMELHEIVYDTESPMTVLFQKGLNLLFPENENSPKIDMGYCEENPGKARGWSEIIRGLLSQRFIGKV